MVFTSSSTVRNLVGIAGKPSPSTVVACIGPAGENQVLFACVMNEMNRAAGRTGVGAVMGSKNLKALVLARPERERRAAILTAEVQKQAAILTAEGCHFYTSDAADDLPRVDLGGRRAIKKKKKNTQ